MKYIVILCDGMADEPLEKLGGKTPLEAARTPNMDRLATGWYAQCRREWPRAVIRRICL